jgi:hypothetical protein
MKSRYFSLCILTMIFYFSAFAGDRSNIRGMGMARTINSASRGTDAIGINPANIALPDIGMFTISLAPMGVMARTELFSLDVYKEYFTGVPGPDGDRVARYLTDQDKNDILSQMPDLPRTKVGVEIMWFGITYQNPVIGGIGIAIIDHAGSLNTVSKDFFRLGFFGLDSLGSMYKFDGTDISSWWYREFSLSYGRKLPFKPNFVNNLYAGISFKVIAGYGVFSTDRQNSSFGNYLIGADQYGLRGNFDFLTRRSGVDFFNGDDSSGNSFELFPAPAGKGFGVDFGFSSEIRSGLRVALSFTDLGSITWDRNVFVSEGGGSVEFNGDLDEMKDTLENVAKGKTYPGSEFKTSLPATLRLGVTMDTKQFPFFNFIPGKMLLAFDYTQGLNNSLGNTTIPRFSLGVEWRVVRFVPIRTGLAVGGGDMVRWAFGTGFNSHYFSLDLATEHIGMVFMPRSFQMASFSLGIKVRV